MALAKELEIVALREVQELRICDEMEIGGGGSIDGRHAVWMNSDFISEIHP